MSDVVYDAFISYRRSDGGRTARWLRRELQAFHPPRTLRDRLPQRLRIYLDTAYERGSTDFFENTIRPALLASRFLIVVATPDAVLRPNGDDDWIAREIDEFSRGPNGHNLLLVRGAGAFDGPLPGDLLARFPNIEIIDLRDVGWLWLFNPLRASRISDEKLKLIAPIIGIPAQDMPVLRREQERLQQARIGAAAGAALALFLTISTLTIYALISRARATTALESTLAATGSLVLKLGGSDGSAAFSKETRKNLVNDVCDLFDGLRKQANADARARPLLVCYAERAKDHEALKEVDQARKFFENAIAEAIGIHARSHSPDDGRSIVLALNELGDFFERQGDTKALAASLKEADPTIAALQADYPNQPFFPEARARRLQRLAGLDELQGQRSEQLSALDKAAALADEAVQKQFEQKQAPLFALKGQLLMSAAVIASRMADVEAALVRLKAAASATDAAARADTSGDAETALNGAAIYAMMAALEAGRGNSEAAGEARAEGRRRLEPLNPSQVTDPSERERLQRIRAALDNRSSATTPATAVDP
jgi:hypothetical protein